MTITVNHSTSADASFSATGATAWNANHTFSGILDVANGGTGTSTPVLVAGTNVSITGTWPNQTINSTGGGGSGTVTNVSVVSANGLAGTVANATTTPAITLSTSITGVLKGNGTAISAAAAGTDYQAPITLTTTGTSGAATFAGNTLNIPNYASGGGSGTVTSVAALTLGTTGTDLSSTVANGTTTPVITLNVPTASASNRGVLNSSDWTTFNNKGSGTVTSIAQTFTGGILSVSGSPITTSGTLALTVAGTSGGIPYFSSGTTWASSAALTQYGVVYGGGAGAAPVSTAAGTTGQVLTATTGGAPTWAAPATSGTVTSVAATVPAFLSVTGSPITSSGTLAIDYSGTALPIANGGTGTSTPALVAGTNVTISGTWPNQTINSSGGGGGASSPIPKLQSWSIGAM